MSQTSTKRLRGLSFAASALRSKPELAAQLAIIMNEWTNVEGMTYALLAQLLPGSDRLELQSANLDAATTILGRIHNFRLRLDIIRAVAKRELGKHALDGHALDIINQAIDEAGKAEGERNKVAHKSFGVCDNYKDALVGIDQEDMLVGWPSDIFDKGAKTPDTPCMIYTKKYLQSIESRMVDAKMNMVKAGIALALHKAALRPLQRGAEHHLPTAAGSDRPDHQGIPEAPEPLPEPSEIAKAEPSPAPREES